VTLHLSPGQDADVSHAETLLGDLEPEAVIGDKGYDSDQLAAEVESVFRADAARALLAEMEVTVSTTRP